MFKCEQCVKSFTRKDNLARHIKVHNERLFICSFCQKLFSRKDNLARHMKNTHANIEVAPRINVPVVPANERIDSDDELCVLAMESAENFGFCDIEESKRTNNENTEAVGRIKRARLNLVGNTPGFVRVGTSFDHTITWYYNKNLKNIFHYPLFLNSVKSELLNILKSSSLPVKFNLKLESTYNKPQLKNSFVNRAFKSSARAIFADSNIVEVIDDMFENILCEEDVYQGKGSGFTLEHIDGILLGVYKYRPMGGSSYLPLPPYVENKKATINPQNDDNKCFKWAILAKHVTGENKYRVSDTYYIHEDKYNFTGLTFPTPMHEIKIFEKNNPTTSVNVYGLQKKFQPPLKFPTYKVFPLKVVDEEKAEHFDLLLLTDEEKSHYSYISNFSRLIRSQKTLHTESVIFCKRCFSHFDSRIRNKLSGQAALEQHLKICGGHKPILPVMPAEGTTLGFEAWSKTQRHPIVIYADFEALLVKCNGEKGSNTTSFQKHNPMSYGLFVKASEDVPITLLEEFDIPQSVIIHRGSNTREEVARHFLETIVEIALKIEKLLKINISILMTNDEEKTHKECRVCNLCKITFTHSNHRVADHSHLSGKFRQTLCNTCNLKLQTPKFVPCFLHNLSNYDAHFIVTELGYDSKTISVIPNSEEKFVSFSKYISSNFTIRFIDSCRFMASSLSSLASNLHTTNYEKFRETRKFFNNDEIPLVTRKGVYPYEYTDSWERLDETILPPKTEFYSTLTESHVTDNDYEHAVSVWNHFNCKNLGEYSDLYLKIDVLLLADVFENFRDICISTYGLDPAFYYTAPGFSFDCMLKYTDIKLELLSDYDMLLMFEKGIRGGLTQASMRYGKANNFKAHDYDSAKPYSWIIYQDCNNLYGWAMSQYMPSDGFKWANPTLDGLYDLTETSPIGRVYEVDIVYPQHLHDKHRDLPFLPDSGIPAGSNVQKLMATVEPKNKYIVHYRNLQQAIDNGLIVEKVHRVIQFTQSSWLAPYINLNTEMRKKATNEFEKDFYKLMNNAVFGKTMESMRKRIKMELVSGEKRLQKLINKTTFKYCTDYENKNLTAVTLENKIIDFCKPIYIGFAVLDVSKSLMYDYHYNVMHAHYKEAIHLMYTDTDSLVYYIETDDFYKDLKDNPILMDRMDTANLPHDHPCYVAERKKIPGLFSDETDGRTITEFCALRAKSYAFKIDGEEKIKAKGIRGHVVKNQMSFEDHEKCLFGETNLEAYRDNVSIRSFNHQLLTIKTKKLTYNSHDDKRYVLQDRIHTLPHGHYKIDAMMKDDEESMLSCF